MKKFLEQLSNSSKYTQFLTFVILLVIFFILNFFLYYLGVNEGAKESSQMTTCTVLDSTQRSKPKYGWMNLDFDSTISTPHYVFFYKKGKEVGQALYDVVYPVINFRVVRKDLTEKYDSTIYESFYNVYLTKNIPKQKSGYRQTLSYYKNGSIVGQEIKFEKDSIPSTTFVQSKN